MTVSLKYRVQEWLADRFTWVQYPNLSRAGSPVRRGLRWKFPMSAGARLDMVLISLFVAVVAGGFLVVVLYLFYAFLIAPLFGL
jgi:hypothetical protein